MDSSAAAPQYAPPPAPAYSAVPPYSSAALLLGLTIVLALLVVWFFLSRQKAPVSGETARRLEAAGWRVMYLRGCGFCTRQERALGPYAGATMCERDGSWSGAEPVVPCGAVNGYPFWINARTQETHAGFMDEKALDRMARAC